MTQTVEPAAPPGPKPVFEGDKHTAEQVLLYIFVILPFLAVLAAIPITWGWGLGWTTAGLAIGFYVLTGLGITVGFHRFFTHAAFKANRPLKIALAIAGSMAIEGPVIRWVADHRRHHAFSDREGDPHSPWRYGETVPALLKGLAYAHARSSPLTCCATAISPSSTASSRCGWGSHSAPRRCSVA
jgi:stearoyl-CoA desaturase (delta-9 desaturase)